MILAVWLLILGAGALLWRDVRPMLDRLIAVQEHRYARPDQKAAEPMPKHLEQMALAWDSEQARDDTRTAMQESYAELGDWTLVASRFSDFFGGEQ